jgi:DNA-binding PadR family transcriptional regulator
MEELETRGFVQPRRLESGAVYTILRRMETRGLLESKWEKITTGPDRRIYGVTDKGIEVLKKGLEIMVKRQSLMKDLETFYNQHFQKPKNIKE